MAAPAKPAAIYGLREQILDNASHHYPSLVGRYQQRLGNGARGYPKATTAFTIVTRTAPEESLVQSNTQFRAMLMFGGRVPGAPRERQLLEGGWASDHVTALENLLLPLEELGVYSETSNGKSAEEGKYASDSKPESGYGLW